MPKRLAQDFKPGEPIDEVFLLSKCELKTARNEALYLAMTLSDKSGDVEARMWDASQALYESLETGTFVRIKGKAETYREQLQFAVKAVLKPEETELRLSDFLPQCERHPGEMMNELKEMLNNIEDEDYRALCDAFLSDDKFCAEFRTAPAAIRYHHSYLGGLLEHTLSMMKVASAILPLYPSVRKDILLPAILLHDIGKTKELNFRRLFEYSDQGQLVGHLVMGVLMLEEKARTIENFPEEKFNVLSHCILSHHGEYEFGSPKLPMTAEAFTLHYLDNLDAKIKDISDIIGDDLQSNSDWTDFQGQYGRRFFKR